MQLLYCYAPVAFGPGAKGLDSAFFDRAIYDWLGHSHKARSLGQIYRQLFGTHRNLRTHAGQWRRGANSVWNFEVFWDAARDGLSQMARAAREAGPTGASCSAR